MSYDDPVCSKCGEVMPHGEEQHTYFECKYEPCMEACRALREPVTMPHYQDAYLHWRYHVPVRQEGEARYVSMAEWLNPDTGPQAKKKPRHPETNDGFDSRGVCDDCQRTRAQGHQGSCDNHPQWRREEPR